MLSVVSSSALAFQAPAIRPTVEVPAVSMNANRNMAAGMAGKYSLKQTVCASLGSNKCFSRLWRSTFHAMCWRASPSLLCSIALGAKQMTR